MKLLKKLGSIIIACICILSFGLLFAGCNGGKSVAEAANNYENLAQQPDYQKFFKTSDNPDNPKLKNYNLDLLNSEFDLSINSLDSNYFYSYKYMRNIANASTTAFNLLYRKVISPKILKTADNKDVKMFSKSIQNLYGIFNEFDANLKIAKNKKDLNPGGNLSDLNVFNNLINSFNKLIDNNVKLSLSTINMFNTSLAKDKLSFNENSVSLVPGQFEALILEPYLKALNFLTNNVILNNTTTGYYVFPDVNTTDTGAYYYILSTIKDDIFDLTDLINTKFTKENIITNVDEFKDKYFNSKDYLNSYFEKQIDVIAALKNINFVDFKTNVTKETLGYGKTNVLTYLNEKCSSLERNSYNLIAKYITSDFKNLYFNTLWKLI